MLGINQVLQKQNNFTQKTKKTDSYEDSSKLSESREIAEILHLPL